MASFEFEELVERYTPLIVNVLLKKLSRQDMVDDVKQEVFIRLYRRYEEGKFDPCEQFENNIDSLSATIKKTCKNTAKNFLRDLYAGPTSFLSTPYQDVYECEIPGDSEYDERGEQLDKMLMSFSDDVNQLIELRRTGVSFKEISRITGMSVRNATVTMSRIVAKLRETAQAEINNE